MTTTIVTTSAGDAELVARSLAGDRDAYAAIVARYQSAICALTYAACGDVHQSEDLAQETFLTGWRTLGNLQNPELLKPWLRGIARNLVQNAQRKFARTPAYQPQPESDALQSGDPTPSDDAISNEEYALLWQNLARLPGEYREPLILFYREHQSVAAVAQALDISQDATRQRLSRGRAMLAQRIEHLLDRGLRQSAPGKGFTLGVVAALPALAAQHPVATAAAAAAAKSGASSKAAATIGSAAGVIFGPLAALFTLYFSYRAGVEQTIASEERRHLRRFWLFTFVMAGGFNLVLLSTIYSAHWLQWGPRALTITLVGMTAIFCMLIATRAMTFRREFQQTRNRLIASDPALAESAKRAARLWYWEYRTTRKLFGLPLMHIQAGSPADMTASSVKAWIAVGVYAYSPLIAVGCVAVAPLSWGATSIGILTYGVMAIGWWSVGVFAIGFKAIGVCAVAWHAAAGIVALAHGYAGGVSAFAHQANNARAARALSADWFFRVWASILEHGNWLWAVALIPLIAMMRRAANLRRAESPAQ